MTEAANGNPLGGQTINLQTSDPASGQFLNTDGSPLTVPLITNIDGQISFLYEDTVAGTAVLTATDSALPRAQGRRRETVDPGQGAEYVVTGNLQTFTAGQNSGPITVQVVDAYGNVVSDQDVALGSSADVNGNQSGQFLSSDGTTNLNSDVNTGASGTATFLYTDTLAGSPVLTLTDNSANIGYEQLTENVDAAAADQIVVSTDSQEFTAGQDSSVVAVKVADAYGNGVADQFVHLNSSSAAGPFIGADLNGDVETNSFGVATFLYTDAIADPVGDLTTLTFHDDTSSVPDAQLTETVDPGAASKIVVSTECQEFTAGHNSSLITVTVEDANGNIVRNQFVALSSSSSAGAFLPDGPTSTISDVNTGNTGSASFLYTDTIAGPVTLTFTGVSADFAQPVGQQTVGQAPVVQAQLQETVDPGPAFGFQHHW